MRRVTVLGDGLIALVGALALHAMGASWFDVAVMAVVAGGLALLILERPHRHHRRHIRRRRGP
jgi:hypothetical protein